jgi:hypothetical protein
LLAPNQLLLSYQAEDKAMVSAKSVEDQFKKIKFNHYGWGRTEARELHNVLLPDEQIYECVNGIYEGGFALLVATNVRVLLIDKKPLNFLSVEDLRFDMISEIDYGHRLVGAQISISTGSKNLRFRSFNQPRLRNLITQVQHCMADTKKKASEHQEDQKQHLEEINMQLQAYLQAQQEQQMEMERQLQEARAHGVAPPPPPAPIRPSNELADYLFAQSLLQQYKQQAPAATPAVPAPDPQVSSMLNSIQATDTSDLYAQGYQEVFGKSLSSQHDEPAAPAPESNQGMAPAPTLPMVQSALANVRQHGLEVNPMRIAYSRLPMAMRNRKFGRPSFHAHSQAVAPKPANG